MTRYAGERPSRTVSLQPLTPRPKAATVTAPAICRRWRLNIGCSVALPLDDSRRDEDQQLVVLVVREIVLEQPAQERHLVQHGRPAFTRLLRAEINSADDRGLPVTDEHRGVGALCVDGRNAVDASPEIGLRVLEV